MTTSEVALAQVEGFRVLRNPAVWIAFVPSAMWVVANLAEDHSNETRLTILIGFPLLIPGFVIVVHAILATLRSRFSNTDELLATLPMGPDRRSVAHGASAFAGFALALAVLRHRRDRTMWLTFAATLAAVLMLGIVQVVVAAEYVASVAP